MATKMACHNERIFGHGMAWLGSKMHRFMMLYKCSEIAFSKTREQETEKTSKPRLEHMASFAFSLFLRCSPCSLLSLIADWSTVTEVCKLKQI